MHPTFSAIYSGSILLEYSTRHVLRIFSARMIRISQFTFSIFLRKFFNFFSQILRGYQALIYEKRI